MSFVAPSIRTQSDFESVGSPGLRRRPGQTRKVHGSCGDCGPRERRVSRSRSDDKSLRNVSSDSGDIVTEISTSISCSSSIDTEERCGLVFNGFDDESSIEIAVAEFARRFGDECAGVARGTIGRLIRFRVVFRA